MGVQHTWVCVLRTILDPGQATSDDGFSHDVYSRQARSVIYLCRISIIPSLWIFPICGVSVFQGPVLIYTFESSGFVQTHPTGITLSPPQLYLPNASAGESPFAGIRWSAANDSSVHMYQIVVDPECESTINLGTAVGEHTVSTSQ